MAGGGGKGPPHLERAIQLQGGGATASYFCGPRSVLLSATPCVSIWEMYTPQGGRLVGEIASGGPASRAKRCAAVAMEGTVPCGVRPTAHVACSLSPLPRVL